MSNYTLTELTELAKFRFDRMEELLPGSEYVGWDDYNEFEKLAAAASIDMLLDEVEARKKNLNPLGIPKTDMFTFNLDSPISSDAMRLYFGTPEPKKPEPRVWDSLSDVPTGVLVKDMDGDHWETSSNGSSRNKIGAQAIRDNLWSPWYEAYEAVDYAPFTEVIDGR